MGPGALLGCRTRPGALWRTLRGAEERGLYGGARKPAHGPAGQPRPRPRAWGAHRSPRGRAAALPAPRPPPQPQRLASCGRTGGRGYPEARPPQVRARLPGSQAEAAGAGPRLGEVTRERSPAKWEPGDPEARQRRRQAAGAGPRLSEVTRKPGSGCPPPVSPQVRARLPGSAPAQAGEGPAGPIQPSPSRVTRKPPGPRRTTNKSHHSSY